MKKTLLTLLAAAALAPAFAQVGMKNSFIAYGSASYSSQRGETEIGSVTIDDPHFRSLSVAPGLGYQFTDRLAVGVNFELYGSKVDFDINNVPGQTEETRSRLLYVGPFVRYTMPIGEHFFWFTQADFSYISGKNRETISGSPDTEIETDVNGVRGRLFPSVGVNFSRTMALAFNIGGVEYNYARIDYGANVEGKTSLLDANLGEVFGFTVQKYFGGRRYGGSRMPMDETRRMDTSDDDEDDDRPRRRRRSRDMDEE